MLSCISGPYSISRTADRILMKFGMKVMPLQASPNSYFLRLCCVVFCCVVFCVLCWVSLIWLGTRHLL
jgi:hypothetical protein